MGAKPRVPLDPVADLERRLARGMRSRAASLAHVRTSVHGWWADHELGEHPAAVGKRIAVALIERDHTIAGTVVLHELLADQLRATDLPGFAQLFAAGHLAEPNAVDAFAIKVLGTMLHRVRGRGEVARALVAWREAETVWQRRAACVAFTVVAAQGNAALPGLMPLLLAMCATVVWSHERFDQTAVGWLLRELSRAEPARVELFFRRHARLMTRECARCAVERYPAARKAELLAHHKRATTIRRD